MVGGKILTFSVVIFVIYHVAAAGVPGRRTKIGDVKTNQEVQELGRYSVEEYNRLQRSKKGGGGGGDLKFSEVVEAEKQVVSGIKYYLKIEARSGGGGGAKVFDAVVVVKPWMHYKKLLNFKPSTK